MINLTNNFKFDNLEIEEITPSATWKRLAEIENLEHELLTDSERIAAIDTRLNKPTDFEIPVFVMGLKSTYANELIEDFMSDVIEMDCVVDSIKTRSGQDGDEKVYDVLLWVNGNNFMRVLMWDDVFPEICCKDITDHEFPYGL